MKLQKPAQFSVNQAGCVAVNRGRGAVINAANVLPAVGAAPNQSSSPMMPGFVAAPQMTTDQLVPGPQMPVAPQPMQTQMQVLHRCCLMPVTDVQENGTRKWLD